MKITVNERTYTIEPVTAIASCDLADNIRQNALLVCYVDDDEEITSVVFGYEMPEDEEDFNTMAEDPFAWESDFEVLATVQNIL